ncbi:acetylxylan esterase [Paenibacillus filicis]|uniref:Acetylxylan esterase n=1 Tax=Paenibacillus filicis TaxID=669464 RepID=A0ABU9DUQ2_9BACL
MFAREAPWNWGQLTTAPAVYPLPELSCEVTGIQACWYQGLPYQGRETRVFAYWGVPSAEPGVKVPAVVLVHGGAGTAFCEWVDLWVHRGYAAIAMDLEGHIPVQNGCTPELRSHPWSGPEKQGVFGDYALPVEDQWMYHAAADVMLAHSFLRTLPQVDQARIGVTGISWGGIITSLVAGIDSRLCFAVPVYGCGYLYERGTLYGEAMAAMPEAEASKLRRLWDPSTYLAGSRVPMLWVNGSNDTHFPLSIFTRSYELQKQTQASSVLSIRQGLGHSHADGWAPEEIYAFADSVTRSGSPLAKLEPVVHEADRLIAHYSSCFPVVSAKLYWSEDRANWRELRWEAEEAWMDEGQSVVVFRKPQAEGSFYVSLTDARGLTVSTPLQALGIPTADTTENQLHDKGDLFNELKKTLDRRDGADPVDHLAAGCLQPDRKPGF